MQFDKGAPLRGYLHSTLVDGARPFRYREGVRSLLGISESEGRNMALPSAIPPVGFRYAEHPVRVGSYQAQTLPNMTGHHILYNDRVEEIENRLSLSSENRITREQTVNPESRTIANRDKERRSVQPEAVAEMSKMEMPGVSKKPTDFSGVIHSSKDFMQSTGDDDQPLFFNKEVSQLRQEPPGTPGERGSGRSRRESGTVEGGLGGKVSAKAKTDSLFQHKMPPAGKDPISGHDGISFVEQMNKIDEMPKSMAAQLSNTQAVTEAVDPISLPKRKLGKPGVGSNIASRGETGSTISHEMPKRNGLFPNPSERASDDFESFNVGAKAAEKSNQDASEKIERLRHSLHELAAKGPSLQTESKKETLSNTPEKIPSPQPQSVVIVRHPTVPNRMPHAFWERRHLSRSHLRILR